MPSPSWEALGRIAMGTQREPFSPRGALLLALEQGAGMGLRATVI